MIDIVRVDIPWTAHLPAETIVFPVNGSGGQRWLDIPEEWLRTAGWVPSNDMYR